MFSPEDFKRLSTKWYITKIEVIPEDQWTTYRFQSDDGKCCVLGHLGARFAAIDTQEAEVLHAKFKMYDMGISSINDGCNEFFRQETPKQRVLAALQYLLRKENGSK